MNGVTVVKGTILRPKPNFDYLWNNYYTSLAFGENVGLLE